jgi:hypothetical protein
VDVRTHDGIPRGLDKYRRRRLEALGNAVSPTQAFPILQSIADLTPPPHRWTFDMGFCPTTDEKIHL